MNTPPYIHCIYIVPLIRVNFKGDIILPNVNLCLKFIFKYFYKLYALDLVYCASRTFLTFLIGTSIRYHSEAAEFPTPNTFIIYAEVMKTTPPLITFVQYFAVFLLYFSDLRKTCPKRWVSPWQSCVKCPELMRRVGQHL